MSTSTLFTILGWSLAAAGAALFAWAMFWDRVRAWRRGRRRRCPKCWYDMTGAPPGTGLRCPECGREVKREKKLFKTRRRWWWAVLALLILAGVGVSTTPAVRQRGIAALAPTTLLVLMSPTYDGTWTSLRSRLWVEMSNRRREGRMWLWQERLLIHQSMDIDEERARTLVAARPAWPRGVPFRVEVKPLATRSDLLGGRVTNAQLIGPAGEAAIAYNCIDLGLRDGMFQPDDPTIEVPIPHEDIHAVQFEIRAGGVKPEDPWDPVDPVLWRQAFETPVSFVDDVSEILTPVRDISLDAVLAARAPTIRLDASGEFLLVDTKMSEALPELVAGGDLTIAGRLEILCDGEVVAARDVWWPLEVIPRRGVINRVWFHGEAVIQRLIDHPDGDWLMRIKSDPLLALRILDIDRYWEGEVTVPLRVRRNGLFILFQR